MFVCFCERLVALYKAIVHSTLKRFGLKQRDAILPLCKEIPCLSRILRVVASQVLQYRGVAGM